MSKLFLIIAAFNGMLAVMIGAFGAHALKEKLTPPLMAAYQTGVQYHFYHLLALMLVAVLLMRWPGAYWLQLSGYGFITGIALFSGSLYLMAITGRRWLGAITPIGGLMFIFAWIAMIMGVFYSVNNE